MSQKYPEGAIIVCKKYSNETWKVVGACGEVRFFIRDECNETPIMQTVYNMEKEGWTVEETPWRPKEGEQYELVGLHGTVQHTNYDLSDDDDRKRIALGNCYKPGTGQAQAAAIRVKATYKVEK